MAKRGKYLKAEEKLRLLEQYLDYDGIMDEFCSEHKVSRATMYRILKEYGGQNYETKELEKDFMLREKELQKEILRLRIENERLKKNYIVRKKEDGKTEYIRLRARNLKS